MAGTVTSGAPTKARIAGFLYLIVVIASVFALMMTQSLISRDAAATATNIQANEQLFRIAFVANLIAAAAYVGVVAILYEVMKPAGRTLSIFAAFFGLTGCAVSGATMLHTITTMVYLGDTAYLAAFSQEQLQAMARLSLRYSAIGNSLALTFFGCYCLSLAFLVFRSTFLPRILGALLAIAGVCWLTNSLTAFVAPQLAGMVGMPTLAAAGLGEGLFCLWIMFMGVNGGKWEEQAARES